MSEQKPAETSVPAASGPQPKKLPEKQAPLGMGDIPIGGEARTELSLLPNCKNFQEVFQLCNWIAESSIVPEAYRGRPADVFVAAEYGADLGLKFMTSVQNIAIISGRPALPSDIKLAMVRGKKLLQYWKEASIEEIKKTGIAWCEMKRVDVDEPMRHTYTIDDAKMARVWEKLGRNDYPTPWVTHKYRMLQLKPRDMCLRDLFGDVFKGLHSVEEAQEIRMIEEEQEAQALIEDKSQPGTKGKEILQAELPPLSAAKPATEEKERVPLARPSEGGQEEGVMGTAATQGKPEPASASNANDSPEEIVRRMIDERVTRIRSYPSGGAALMAVWSKFKLPAAQFGKVATSSLLGIDILAQFNEELGELILILESGGVRKQGK